MTRANRRSFLSGRAAVRSVEAAGESITNSVLGEQRELAPAAADTVRIETRAMACTWQVILNAGDRAAVMHASDALDLVHHLESLMTTYRDDGQLAIVNQQAAKCPVPIDPLLTDALTRSLALTRETGRAFDVTSGAFVRLWQRCRQERRLPRKDEVTEAAACTGPDLVEIDAQNHTVAFLKPGLELNLGGSGKGYALDLAAAFLIEQGVSDFLIHGGASSVLARGVHGGAGWPVGVKNPLLNDQSLATLILGDSTNAAGRALGTSGGNVQYFRLNGRKYGHILDPRTGWPAEQLLSASVVAKDAMTADALSTAAFVAGRRAVLGWCDDELCEGALLSPLGSQRDIVPEVCQLAKESLFSTGSISSDELRGSPSGPP